MGNLEISRHEFQLNSRSNDFIERKTSTKESYLNMTKTFTDLPEVDREKAKQDFENALLTSFEALSPIEYSALCCFHGLKGTPRHELCDVAIMARKTIPDLKRILGVAHKKCLHDPIQNLLREASQRATRFSRHKGEDGYADMELVRILLRKADALNDCRIVYSINPRQS